MKNIATCFFWAFFGLCLLAGQLGCPHSPVGKLTLGDAGWGGDETWPWEVTDGSMGFSVCEPCVADETCQDAFCIPLDDGDFCLQRCDSYECPPGFECLETPAGEFCVPSGGACTCSPEQIGEQKACSKSNEAGQCMGLATCYPDKGWVCDAGTPTEEVCDHEDNNCDGETDEGFMTGEWYFGPENCGDCGITCDDEIENGAGYCSLSPPPPSCKVSVCDPGYYSPDGLICTLLVGSACVECADDSDCAGGECFELDGENVCLPECGDSCPEGYECKELEEGDFCYPLTASCQCTPASVGMEKSCANSNDFGTCVGVQKCEPAGWSPCSALQPGPEECNGADDDCNGTVDEELSGVEPCANTIPGIGSCPGFLICEGETGYICDAPEPEAEICDYKDNNCDKTVDEGYLDPESGMYLTDTDCGTCGNDCTLTLYPQAMSLCVVADEVPACTMVCLEGWVDLNLDPADGCECEFISAEDPPDGVDQNCDGIDGDPANAVFVSPGGNDLNPGTPEKPVRTISMGIQRCLEQSKGHVYVAEGVYEETVNLQDGIQVFGGFSADFSVRNIDKHLSGLEAPELAIPGQVRATVVALGVGTTMSSFEGFTVTGPFAVETGISSYALYLRDCKEMLIIQDNIILAGDAGDGEDGEDGLDGVDGNGGSSGNAAFDTGTDDCYGILSSGASGGFNTCGGIDVSGGLGGTSVCPDYDQNSGPDKCPLEGQWQDSQEVELGKSGKPLGPGGAGGEAGQDAIMTVLYDGKVCLSDYENCSYCHLSLWGTDGQSGGPGNAGTHGLGGSACSETDGVTINGEWLALTGAAGGDGKTGTGGGGGGAGGGVETWGCWDMLGGYDIGGSGGGGGSGGCPGSGGQQGTGGGGSFGVFILWSADAPGLPQVKANTIDTGFGGAAGGGGKGGVGGTGGWGGTGGSDGAGQEFLWCAGEGGEGGHGGNGGSGGGGGGSCGGLSIGLFVQPGKAPMDYLLQLKSNNVVNLSGGGGVGGQGGSSKGNFGKSGKAGKHEKCNF